MNSHNSTREYTLIELPEEGTNTTMQNKSTKPITPPSPKNINEKEKPEEMALQAIEK